MITIIHGDDISASRKFYVGLKQHYPEHTALEGQNIDLTNLTQILEGGDLFHEEKILFIEQLFIKKKTSTDFKPILTYLANPSLSAKIILWEGKEIDRTSLSGFKNASVKIFKLPQSLFLFLDAIKPGNGATLLKLFHQAIEYVEPEAVFPMLVRQIRLLLALHPNSQTRSPLLDGEDKGEVSQIDEIKRMQDWQRSKLEAQARLFTSKQLTHLFCQLFVREKEIKTGTLNSNLVTAIDILLLEI